MKKRVAAKDVRVGDHILTCYAPRTWALVTEVRHERPGLYGSNLCIALDTATNRTWWTPADLVPCRQAAILKAHKGKR